MSAGLRSGDRIVAIDGTTAPEFEDIRREIKNGKPSHHLVFERDGANRTVHVVPDEDGAIKVTSMMERRSIPLVNAVTGAVRGIARTVSGLLGHARESAQLVGPVAIVKTAQAGRTSSFWERILAVSSYVVLTIALLIAVLHLFDGLTYGSYRLRLRGSAAARPRGTLGRRRQALGLALFLGLLGIAAGRALARGSAPS